LLSHHTNLDGRNSSADSGLTQGNPTKYLIIL